MSGLDLGLQQAVILITGAASGIGAAVARAAAEMGAHPVLADRDGAAVEACAESIGPVATSVRMDVTDEAQVRGTLSEVARSHGGLDVVVTCAGISGPVGDRVEQTSLADFDQVLRVNVLGTFLVLKHALPLLRASRRGAAVLLASDSATVAAPGMAAYGASKAAVVQLARATSVECAGEVRVNALCPSIVDTPMSRADLGAAAISSAEHPVHDPRAVAGHVLYLASSASVGIHGAAVMADFGYGARSSLPA